MTREALQRLIERLEMTVPFFARLRIRERLLPILLGQGIGLLCGLMGVHFTTRLIAPATYGMYGIFISFTPLGVWVFHAGLIKWVGRHWASVTVPLAALRSLLPSATRTLPGFLITAFTLEAANGGQFSIVGVALLILSALALSLAYLSQAALQATRRHWADFSVSSVGACSRTILPLLLYAVSPSLLSLEFGFVLHSLCFASIGLWSLLRKPLQSDSPNPPFKEIYGGRLFLALAITHGVLTGINRWIAGGFFSAEYAGLFTLASNIASVPTSMLGVIVAQWFQPDLFKQALHSIENKKALAARIDFIALTFTILAFTGLLVLRFSLQQIPGVFIDEKYAHALPLVFAAGAFTSTIFIGQFFQTMLLAAHLESRCGWIDIPCGAFLAIAGVASAWLGGRQAFEFVLCLSPLIPWFYNRTLARKFLFASPE